MNARAMLEQAVAENASDIFLVAGRPLSLRKNGVLSMENEERLLPDDTAAFLKEIYELADNRDMRSLLSHGDDDFSFAIPGVSRFRVSAYKQRGTLSAVIRVITFRLPDYHMLGIPDAIINLGLGGKGMTLITGPAGSGKSTTLACIIDQINQNQEKHIITLEDPLEFLHRHNKSIVSQREIHVDTDSYVGIHYGAAVKLWLLATFFITALLPAGLFVGLNGALIYFAAIFATAVIIGIVESVMARFRFLKVPQMLMAALCLAVIAIVLLLIFEGTIQ